MFYDVDENFYYNDYEYKNKNNDKLNKNKNTIISKSSEALIEITKFIKEEDKGPYILTIIIGK